MERQAPRLDLSEMDAMINPESQVELLRSTSATASGTAPPGLNLLFYNKAETGLIVWNVRMNKIDYTVLKGFNLFRFNMLI